MDDSSLHLSFRQVPSQLPVIDLNNINQFFSRNCDEDPHLSTRYNSNSSISSNHNQSVLPFPRILKRHTYLESWAGSDPANC